MTTIAGNHFELNTYAEAQLQALDEPSLKSDAGVQAVITTLLAYPRQTIQDLSDVTGFHEERVRKYLDALGDFVESDGAGWSVSARGKSGIEYALAVGTGRAKAGGSFSITALTAVEAKRWTEVKRIVMDTSPSRPGEKTLRTQYEHWFHFADSNPPKTLAEATAQHFTPKPGEADASVTFGNQPYMGLTIHRPGTIPTVDFGTLIQRFQVTDDDSLIDSDGLLIQKALGLGLSFW